jgi:PII-like signaling protein
MTPNPRPPADAARLLAASIHLRESDLWRHVPVYTEIVRRARNAGLAGATVLRGIAGLGRSGHIQRARGLRPGRGLPVVVVLVEQERRLTEFLRQLGELDISGLIVLEDVLSVTGDRRRWSYAGA